MDKKEIAGKHRERHTLYLLNIIGLCLLTIAAIAVAAIMLMRSRSLAKELAGTREALNALQGEDKTLYTAEQLQQEVTTAGERAARTERSTILMQIQSSLESGNSTTSMLRGLFADDLVVVSGGKYYFYPVISSLSKNPFRKGDFRFDDAGFLQYKGDDESVTVRHGIDVTEDNGEIDWQLVAESGVTFAMVCAGGRDEEGEIIEDENFAANVEGAAENGLDVGIFFATGATSTEEAVEEATYVTTLLSTYRDTIKLPVAVMVPSLTGDARTAGLTKTQNSENLQAFCDVIRAASYDTLLYGNLASLVMDTDLSKLGGDGKWVQDYSDNLYYPYDFAMWQYSASGKIQGIEGDVGLNLEVKH